MYPKKMLLISWLWRPILFKGRRGVKRSCFVSKPLSQISHIQILLSISQNTYPQIWYTYLLNPIPTSNSYIKFLTFSYHILLPLLCQEPLRFSILLQTHRSLQSLMLTRLRGLLLLSPPPKVILFIHPPRPDIAYVVSVVSQFMHSPNVSYRNAVDRILMTGPDPNSALEFEPSPVRVRHLANVGHKWPFYPSRFKFF